MNKANLLRFSVRLANSLFSTRQPGLQWLRLNQVTHLSYLCQCPLFHLSKSPTSCYVSPKFNQNLYFSSKTEPFIDLILSSNDWSDEFENELEKLNPKITHESVVYVLTKLNRNPEKLFSFFKYACDRKGFQPSYMPYCLVLKSLACGECMENFWAVASQMKEKGFCIDDQVNGAICKALKQKNLDQMVTKWAEFYQSMRESNGQIDVAKDVAKLISGSDWSKQVEIKLEKLKFRLDDHFVFEVIWKLKDEPLKALKFFEWISTSLKYEHNSLTYCRMARILAWHNRLIDEFWNLFMRMRSEGYEIDIDTYIKISRSIRVEDAVKLFEFMMDGPYKLSEQDCVWLLRKLAQRNDADIELVNRVANKYLEAGNTCTKAIYDVIHRSLCNVGRFDEANKIVDNMRNAGYKPDNITYSQEVFGLCKQRKFEDARRVLDRMEVEGCVPDLKTWTVLIQGYCGANQVDEALSCLAQMMDKNVEPDADLLEVFVKGFISVKKLLGAYKILVKMVNKSHLKPWQATYKLMIEKLLEGGFLEEAFKLLSLMKEQNYPAHNDAFVMYISKSGTLEDAKKFLSTLQLKDSYAPASYVKVISSFIEHGRLCDAKDLFDGSPRIVRNHKKFKKVFGGIKSSS